MQKIEPEWLFSVPQISSGKLLVTTPSYVCLHVCPRGDMCVCVCVRACVCARVCPPGNATLRHNNASRDSPSGSVTNTSSSSSPVVGVGGVRGSGDDGGVSDTEDADATACCACAARRADAP